MKKILVPVFVIIFFLAGTFSVMAYTDEGTHFSCNSCSDCTAALNDGTYRDVRLTTDIRNHQGTCIDDPAGFVDKVFECNGHVIEGTNSGYGFYLEGKNFNFIQNCIIRNFDTGILLDSSDGNAIIGTELISNKFGLVSKNSESGNVLDNSKISSNSNIGVLLGPSESKSILRDNIFISNKIGIRISGSSKTNLIRNNIINTSSEAGISVEDNSENNRIIDNTLFSTKHGVRVSSSNNNEIQKNSLSSNVYGIRVHSSNFSLIKENIFESNENSIHLSSSSFNELLENIVQQNFKGISILFSSNSNILEKNQILSNSMEGVYIDSSDGNFLDTNNLQLNMFGIILSSTEETIIYNNSILRNDYSGVRLSLSSDTNISNNNIEQNNEEGISIYGGSENTLHTNEVIFNGGRGIHMLQTNNNELKDNFLLDNNINLFVEGESSNHFNHDIDHTNSVNYEPVLYIYDRDGGSIDGNSTEVNSTNHITIAYSNDITIKNFNLTGDPIYLVNTNNSNILNSNISYSYYGVYLVDSHENEIKNCSQVYNEHGIYLRRSSNNLLKSNVAYLNRGYGIYLGRSPDTILEDNTLDGNMEINLFVAGDSPIHYDQNIDTSNTVNGLPAYYFFDKNDYEFSGEHNETHHLTFAYSNDVGIFDVDISGGDPIHLIAVNNSRIRYSKVSNSYYGIYLKNSNSNTLTLNNLNSNEYGLYIEESAENNLVQNSMNDNNRVNLFVTGSSIEHFNQEIDEDNVINGGSIIYVYDESGYTLDGATQSDITHITLAYVTDSTIRNINMSGSDPIHLVGTKNTVVRDSKVSETGYGIYLTNSEENMIRNNIVSSNNYGVMLSSSSKNVIRNNKITENSEYGAYVTGTNNRVFNNYFEENTINAMTSDENIWNTSITSANNILGGPFLGGNYWHDYTGQDTTGDGIGNEFLPHTSGGRISPGGDYLPLVSIPPTGKIVEISPSPAFFGDTISFKGAVDLGTAEDVDSYEWYSSIDGDLSDGRNFNTSNLKLGLHNISLRVLSHETWSPPVYSNLQVNLPSLGDPVKVLPRFLTKGKSARTYGMPSQGKPTEIASYSDCDISPPPGETEDHCILFNVSRVGGCSISQTRESPILDFKLEDTGSYRFFIGTKDESKTSRIGVGNVKLRLIDETLEDYPEDFFEDELEFTIDKTLFNFGVLKDGDVMPSGYKILFQTSENINKRKQNGNWTSGAFYSLYKVVDCDLVEDTSLSEAAYVGAARDKFVVFAAPSTCSPGETCDYVGELVVSDGTKVGGMMFKFTYQREKGDLEVNQSSLNFGMAAPGELVSGTVELTAVNNAVFNITATGPRSLSASPGKTAIQAGESTSLSVNIQVPLNITEGKHTRYINLSWMSLGTNQKENMAFPVIYEAYFPETDLLISPSRHNFGLIGLGYSKTAKFTLKNMGNETLEDLQITLPERYSYSLGSRTLASDQSASLDITLSIPADSEEGKGNDTAVISWDEGSAFIFLSYNAKDIIPVDGKVSPSKWDIGEISPGSTSQKTFQISLTQGDPEDIDVSVIPSKSSIFSASSSNFNLGDTNEVRVDFTAPSEEKSYSENILFEFYQSGELSDSVSVPVSFVVEVDVQKLLNSAQGRLSNSKSRLNNIRAQAVEGSPLFRSIESNLSSAKIHLNRAEEHLINAQMTLAEEDEEGATFLINEANSELARVDSIIEKVEALLTEPRSSFLQRFKFVFIAIIIGTGLTVFFLAAREGWLPPEISEKLGFKSRSHQVKIKPKPRFTPEAPHDLSSIQRELPSRPRYRPQTEQPLTHSEDKYQKQKKRAYSNNRFE